MTKSLISNRKALILLLVVAVTAGLFAIPAAAQEAPTITQLTPEIGATDVSVNDGIMITLSELPNASNFNLATDASFQCNGEDVALQATLGQGPLEFILFSTTPFEEGATCEGTIDLTKITNFAGTPFADNLDGEDDGTLNYSFTVVNNPPAIEAVTPMDGAMDVSKDTVITVDMSEPISGLNPPGFSFICGVEQQPLPTVTGFDADNTIYELTPSQSLPLGETCTFSVTTTAWEDAAGATIVDNQDPTDDNLYTWSFTVESGPEIESVSPSDGEMNVAADAMIIIDVTERIQNVAGQAPGFTFVCGSDAQPAPMIMFDEGMAIYELTPSEALPAGETCTFTVTTTAWEDLDGNLLQDNQDPADDTYVWSFEVAPDLPPEITMVDPMNGATDVALDQTITFTLSELPLTLGSDFTTSFTTTCGNVNIQVNNQNNTVTMSPVEADRTTPSTWLAGMECTISWDVTQVLDSAGNTLVDNDSNPSDNTYTYTFTTVQTMQTLALESATAPVIESAE